jgi:DTW domain-containing protein YfiP
MTAERAPPHPTAPPQSGGAEKCIDCLKPLSLCVCAGIEAFANRVELVIIQHPQEQDRELGTARLALRHFARARLVIGLSWSNLSKLIGRPAEPARWGVLYLGSAKSEMPGLAVLDRQGAALADPAPVLAALEGVILLDGSWSQAKALWWRNAWMLKCRRIVLETGRPSRYGRLRREPRPDSVSTLEAAAFVLSRLEARPELEVRMMASFDAMLRKYREARLGKPSS